MSAAGEHQTIMFTQCIIIFFSKLPSMHVHIVNKLKIVSIVLTVSQVGECCHTYYYQDKTPPFQISLPSYNLDDLLPYSSTSSIDTKYFL